MYFNFLQILQTNHLDLLNTGSNLVFDIQAIQKSDLIFSIYIGLSFMTLLLMSFSYLLKQKKVTFYNVFSFLRSEQEGFRLFINQKRDKIKGILVFIFFVIQVSYLGSRFFDLRLEIMPNTSIIGMNAIFLALILLLVFYIKTVVSNQLSHLSKADFDIKYYQFTYSYPLFLLSLCLFLVTICEYNYQFVYSKILYLGIVTFFYVWLIIRWIFISVRYQTMNSLYFFLYLCTLEVAPLLLVIGLSRY